MDNDGGQKKSDFYAVMGLKKECTAVELRDAYKKLALRWHPDRCIASGNSKHVEEAKKNFQIIQEAYSVLSDDEKRFTYDVGVYDNDNDDDDDENGMDDFLNEMVAMMSQTNSNVRTAGKLVRFDTTIDTHLPELDLGMDDFLNEMVAMISQTNSNDYVERSFEDLQSLFEEMFQGDIDSLGCGSQNVKSSGGCSTTTPTTTYVSYFESADSNHKRNMTEMYRGNNGVEDSNGFVCHYQGFCLGAGGTGSGEGNGKRCTPRRTRR